MVLPLQTLIFISSFFCRSFLFARNQDFKITKNRINNQHNMRDRGGVGGTAPAFLLNLLGFWHCHDMERDLNQPYRSPTKQSSSDFVHSQGHFVYFILLLF
ncbi:hypothetical protein HanHA89_Chr11g0413091 [Helianthus annuus]|nr:hypothetical protein HanHA89_Chr11g0413091 [Helianthus annuus]